MQKLEWLVATVAATMLVLAGCGGGSGGSSNAQSTTPSDTIGINQSEDAKLTHFKDEDLIETPIGTIERSRISILLDDAADNAIFEAAVKANGWQVKSFIKPPINSYSIDVGSRSFEELIAALEVARTLPGVATVNVVRELPTTAIEPNDRLYGNPYGSTGWKYVWNQYAIDLPEAWGAVYSLTTVPRVKIGIIDQGFNTSHIDKPVKEIITGAGLNAQENHGMHVAGIIAAAGNDGEGLAGVSWSSKGVDLFAAESQRYDETEILYNLNRLLLQGVRVVNMSVSAMWKGKDEICWFQPWDYVKKTANYCDSYEKMSADSVGSLALMKKVKLTVEGLESRDPGYSVLFVQSSGNTGLKEILNTGQYPESDLGGLFAVAVSDTLDADASLKAFFQQRTLVVGSFSQESQASAKKIEPYTNKPRINSSGYGFILAPGGSESTPVWSALNSVDGHGHMFGTSQAAPHVAGVAGLILQANPSLSASEVRNIILENSDQVDGYRALNAAKAVRAAMPSQSASPILEAITTKTYILDGSGLCYQTWQATSQIAPTRYKMAEGQWCLNSSQDQWVPENSGGGNLEILLPSGVWVSESDESVEIVNDTTFNLMFGGVEMGSGSVTKNGIVYGWSFVYGNPRYEIWPFGYESLSTHIYDTVGSIPSLIGGFNISSSSGSSLSAGGPYGLVFGGASSDTSGAIYVVDRDTQPNCTSGSCEWTVLATGTWSRMTAGTSDIVTVTIPSPYQTYFVGSADEKLMYVKRSTESGVREGRYTAGSHIENWSAYAKSSFDALLQQRGLPPASN